MFKKLICSFAFCTVTILSIAQIPGPYHAGGNKNDSGVQIAGYWNDRTIAIGSTQSFGDPAGDGYIVAFNQDHSVSFEMTTGMQGDDQFNVIFPSNNPLILAGSVTDASGDRDILLSLLPLGGTALTSTVFGMDSLLERPTAASSSYPFQLLGGIATAPATGNNYAFLTKIDAQGNIVNTQYFPVPVGTQLKFINFYFNFPEVEMIMGGTVHTGPGQEDVFLRRIKQNGIEIWTKTIGTSQREILTALGTFSEERGVILAGNLIGGTDQDVFVAGVNGNGDLMWVQNFFEPGIQELNCVSTYNLGNWMASGNNYLPGNSQVRVILGNPTGGILFNSSIGTPAGELSASSRVFSNQKWIFTGTTDMPSNGSLDLMILETDTMGNILSTYEDSGPEGPISINIWPNPNAGQFTVDMGLSHKKILRLSLYNMLGQEVAMNYSLEDNGAAVVVPPVASGVYVLRVEPEGGAIIHRRMEIVQGWD